MSGFNKLWGDFLLNESFNEIIRALSNNEKIEAATFRRIISHLRENPDVQNIDLMNLANFCRNCISKWYVAESEKNGEHISCLLYTSPSPRDS